MAVIVLEDLLIRASTVEHELKHAFVKTLPRLVRMQMDGYSVSFEVSFQKYEVFLKQLFCDCLFSNALKYHKDEKGVLLHEKKYIASFLNSLYTAAKEFKDQMILMENRSESVLVSSSSFFSASPQSGEHLSEQLGLGKY